MNGTKWGRVDVMTLVSYVDATGTNKADVLATDRGGSIKVCAKMGTHRTTPPFAAFIFLDLRRTLIVSGQP